MTRGGRYVLIGLARTRRAWFTELARWATSGAIPAEFVKAVSVEETEARLLSGRRFSALLVDAAVPGWGRDTVSLATAQGCAVIVVDDGAACRSWEDVDVDAVLTVGFDRSRLLDTLRSVAEPVTRADDISQLPSSTGSARVGGRPRQGKVAVRGRLVAVTGAPGTGRSTLAMALAADLSFDPRNRGLVLLADLALNAQLGLLHDAGDVVPGLVELVDAHRRASPDVGEVRRLCFAVADGGYDLLLGLPRPRDWTALRPQSTAAALDSLRAAYRIVVADVDGEVEGEAETGSVDLEERNQLGRVALSRADLVVAVGRSGLGGLHALLRVLCDLVRFGVAPDRLLAVFNCAPRSRPRRAELGTALTQLLESALPGVELAAGPIFVGERRRLDDLVSDGVRLPPSLGEPVTRTVRTLLDQVRASGPDRAGESWPGAEPHPVAPGSVGSWTELTGEHAQ